MKLWQGMLSGELDDLAEKFNASISVDQRMVMEDIQGSLAHSKMLGETRILDKESVDQIQEGLQSIKSDLQAGCLEIDPQAEDVHTFIEGELTKRIGDAGKMLHTARSRNDQVVTDFKLNLKKEVQEIKTCLTSYIQALLEKAEGNLDTVMPGYTHLQAAQPVTFAHHMMAYTMMGMRDMERLHDLNKRLDESPLGACALAGTSYPIDRELTAQYLGFSRIMQNSMDAVSDRDFVIEFQGVLSIISMHLSRQAEEFIIWCSQPYQFISMDDRYSTGSSIMPQKKNPDIAELIRGKSSLVYGRLMQSLTMMKSLPLAYAKDMQDDKISLFESIDTVKDCLLLMAQMIETMTVHKEKLEKAAHDGFLNATDVADYLVRKGMPFRDAHHTSAHLVDLASKNNKTLAQLSLDEYKNESELFEEDIYEEIDLLKSVKSRTSLGGPAPEEVKRQIQWVKDQIDQYKN